MTLIFIRRAGLVFLLFVSFGTLRATAGQVYLALVIDPATTAGFGVPTIPRQLSTGSFSVTSNKSGPGSFHLYALDNTTGSFGLSYFNVALTGTLTNVFNRSPIASFDTLDDQGDSTGQSGAAGFSDSLLRSGPPWLTLPVQGAQGIGSQFRIGGMGQTANNFNNTPNLSIPPSGGARVWAGVTSGAWGNYATDPNYNYAGKSWLLLGEGNYSGQVPGINYSNSAAYYYSAANFDSQSQATIFPPCLCGISVSGGTINNVNANNPGFVDHTWTYFADLPEPGGVTWGPFPPPEYYATPGGGPSPFIGQLPTFDPLTGKFHWNTIGSPIGQYRWRLSASAQGYTDIGILDVFITTVPEPAALSLITLATLGGIGFTRRRRGSARVGIWFPSTHVLFRANS